MREDSLPKSKQEAKTEEGAGTGTVSYNVILLGGLIPWRLCNESNKRQARVLSLVFECRNSYQPARPPTAEFRAIS